MVAYFTIRIHVCTYICKTLHFKTICTFGLHSLSPLSPGNNLAKLNLIRPKLRITLPGLVKKINLQFSQHPSITPLEYHTHEIQSTYIVQYTTQPHSRLSIRQPKPINHPFIQRLLSSIYYYLYIDTNFNIFSTTSITLQFI